MLVANLGVVSTRPMLTTFKSNYKIKIFLSICHLLNPASNVALVFCSSQLPNREIPGHRSCYFYCKTETGFLETSSVFYLCEPDSGCIEMNLKVGVEMYSTFKSFLIGIN